MYYVKSILVSSNEIQRNDVINHTMLVDIFLLQRTFVTPADISIRTFFLHAVSIYVTLVQENC